MSFCKWTLSALLACAVLAPAWADEAETTEAKKPATKPHIDVALLLDTSNSMDGLINQARTQLWSIVNEFETVRRNGVRPVLRVALYEYGNQGLAQESGYIRQVCPLTTNLDKISEELFALTTNGGDEYCGQVIARAVDQLEWADAPGSMHAIFIAGNEPFTQGPVDYKVACKNATAKNITISTIHCGSHDEGVTGMWADGAKISDGEYLVIDQDKVMPGIEAPQDKELAELNKKLNGTYIAYGSDAERKKVLNRQVAQDNNAANAAPAAIASRIATKAGGNYQNSSWDLLDAVRDEKIDLTKIPKEQLPEKLRKMTAEELTAHIKEQRECRADLQAKIKALTTARNKYIAAEHAKLAESTEDLLESAVAGAARSQAEAEGFEFVEEE